MKVEPRTLWKAIIEEATHTGGCGSLPSSWRWVKLGDVVLNSVSGGTPEKIRRQYWGGSIHWASVKDLRGDTLDTTQDFITEEGLQKSSAKLIPAGNIIVCMRMALGKIVINTIDTAINQDLRAVFLRDCVLQKYFFYVFKSLEVTIKNKGRGTTVNGITFKDLYSLPFPLPPIDEQREIVARLEPLLREVEELDEHYQRYKHAKEVFRKAAIQDAVYFKEGDELPEGWKWVALGDVCECLDHLRKPVNYATRKTREGDIPYYGATGQIGWIDDYLTNEELVLLGEDAAPFLQQFRDKAYMIDGKAWVNNHAHILRSYYGHVGNSYILYYLNSFNYFGYVWGTTRLKLTKKTMMRIPVPLPPRDEQLHIVSYLDNLIHQLDIIS